MKKKQSLAWQFYDDTVNNDGRRSNIQICKLCSLKIKHSGNTTNLRSHITRKHPLQWNLAMERDKILQSDDESSASKQSKYAMMYDETSRSEAEVDKDTETEQVQEDDDKTDCDEEWLEADAIELQYNIKSEPRAKGQRRQVRRSRKSPHTRNHPDLDQDHPVSNRDRPVSNRDPLVSNWDRPVSNWDHPVSNRDHMDAFGDYVARRLRELPPGPARANVEQLMGTLLWQAELGAYNDTDAVRRLVLNMVVDRPIISYPSEVAFENGDVANPTVSVTDAAADTAP